MRRNSDRDDLARVEVRAPGTEEADSRQKIFTRNLIDHLILHRRVGHEFRLADEGRAGTRADPHNYRAAAPDSPRLPAGRVGVDEDLIVGPGDEPYRYGSALVAVFAHGRDIDVALAGERGNCRAAKRPHRQSRPA